MSDMIKSGYVAIVGKPNAGKSTLLNSILDFKLSIVSPKPQTTRKKVLGIFTEEDLQIIFLDTPGLLNPRYEMQKSMMSYVDSSIAEADLLLYILDVSEHKKDQFPDKISKSLLENFKGPKVLVINKIDLLKDVKTILPMMADISQLGTFDEIVPISAKKSENTKNLIEAIKNHLPEGNFYYNPEILSTEPQRFFVSELIREQIFYRFKEEIPYSTEVSIADFKERERGKWYISAEIVVERDNQKKILIGKNGDMIKMIGQKSRVAIEEHLGMEVFLELFVKVRKDWRNNKTYLKSFGY